MRGAGIAEAAATKPGATTMASKDKVEPYHREPVLPAILFI